MEHRKINNNMTSSRKHNKIFGSIGIILILFPLVFFVQPQKTEAVVPTNDAELNWTMDEFVYGKEFVADGVFWMIARGLIHGISQNIVEWIQNDFEGGPGFITNLGGFMTDFADNATGIMMHEYLSDTVYSALCSPWRSDIGLALRLRRSTEYKYPECTLTDAMNNVEKFGKMIGDFRYSSWDDWISIGQSTTNNPYGLYLEMSAEQDRRIADAKAKADTEAKMNVGFLGFNVCAEEDKIYDDFTGKVYCTNWQTKTPGKYVEDVLSSATNLELSKLGVADEIQEILAELASYLVRRIMGSGGLLDVGETPEPPETEKAILIKNIDTLIGTETIYKQTKENTQNTYPTATSTYSSAKACYGAYLVLIGICEASGGRMEVDSAYINGRMSYIDTEVGKMNIPPGLGEEIISSGQIITDLQDLKRRVAELSSYDDLYDYYNEYYVILTTRAHNSTDQRTADAELTTAGEAKEDANDELENCTGLSKICDRSVY